VLVVVFVVVLVFMLNWWKGKPPGSIACTRKRQPRFYWSCSSVVMNDATPLTPPNAWAELHFQMSTTYMYTPWSLRTRKIWLHNDVVRGDFLQPPNRHWQSHWPHSAKLFRIAFDLWGWFANKKNSKRS